jgi:hypothetical protein
MGEVGITDRNMLALRREHPSLIVHKHSVHEEIRTGADWEWWINTQDGWLCVVFQAKLLDINGRYCGISKGQSEGKPQVDLLLGSCLLRSERLNTAIWPLYCFYNSWQGGWPVNVNRFDGIDPHTMPEDQIRLYGCSITDAWSVRRVLFDKQYSHRRTLRDSYLPISRPWSMILGSSGESAEHEAGRSIMMALSSLAFPRMERRLNPGNRQSMKLRRRDRMTIYHNPIFASRPPDYVFDLLEGTIRPRRLKPLARRIAILPE